MSEKEYFEEMGCVRVKNLLDEKTISIISRYMEYKIRRGEWKTNAAGVAIDPTSEYSYYGDPLIEVVLQDTKESIEKIIGKKLIPTYSYARVYQPGESLKPHVDRDACEVSVTISVASKGSISPIYTRYEKKPVEVHVLNPGDAVIYKGCEALHWRDVLEKDQLVVQFMLHYVDENGSFAHLAKDTRPNYGMSEFTRTIK
jgi:hypothetical protein